MPGEGTGARKQGPRRSGSFRKARIDWRQPDLIAYRSILDFLEPGDPTLWVLELQERIPLSLFGESSVYGGFEYDPRVLFTLWMFGLWTGGMSSRKLETAARRDVRFIALAQGLRPDHATLCRFRRGLGDSIGSLMKYTVDLAREAGLVGFRRGHVDGHRLPGNVSQWRKLVNEAEAEDRRDEGSEATAEQGKAAPSDPDARLIKTKKGFVTGYNAQALADEESGIVLSACVSNSSSDGAELEPLLDRCIETHEDLPDSVAADKGFDTPRNAYAMELLGVEGFIPAHMPSVFTLDEEEKVVCPAGHEPDKLRRFKAKGVEVLQRCATQCEGCALWEHCSKVGERRKGRSKVRKRCKTIRTPADVPIPPWLRMHERASSERGKEAMRKRASTVERLFAHTKNRLGLRSFSLRGLDLVDLEWNLTMVSHNLWRIRNAGVELVLASLRRLLRRFVTLSSPSPAHCFPPHERAAYPAYAA